MSAENKQLSSKVALKNKIIWTCVIHVIAIVFFICSFYFSALYTWIQNTEFRSMGASTPIGAVFIVLPALLITLIWAGGDLREKTLMEKILFSCWLIFNVALTLIYIFLIWSFFQ